jgi:hypothetical protein
MPVAGSWPEGSGKSSFVLVHFHHVRPESTVSYVVKLEDDLGERSEWVLLHGVLPGRAEREFPLLRCVDPFGKTLFNHLQMESFLEEWERLRDRARDDTQRDAWEKIRELALSCQQDRDLNLRFVGN